MEKLKIGNYYFVILDSLKVTTDIPDYYVVLYPTTTDLIYDELNNKYLPPYGSYIKRVKYHDFYFSKEILFNIIRQSIENKKLNIRIIENKMIYDSKIRKHKYYSILEIRCIVVINNIPTEFIITLKKRLHKLQKL